MLRRCKSYWTVVRSQYARYCSNLSFQTDLLEFTKSKRQLEENGENTKLDDDFENLNRREFHRKTAFKQKESEIILNRAKERLKSAKKEEIQTIFRDIKKAKADPDISVFNMCMSIFAKSYSMKEAEKLWADIKLHSLAPNLVSYNSLLQVYAKLGEHEKALKLFEEVLEDVGYDLYTYHAVMEACITAGEPEKALQLFLDLREKGLHPSDVTLNLVLQICIQTQDFKLAQQAFKRLSSPSFVAYKTFLIVCKSCEEWKRGLKTFHTINDSFGFNEQVLRLGIFMLAKLNRWDEVFSELTDACSTKVSPVPGLFLPLFAIVPDQSISDRLYTFALESVPESKQLLIHSAYLNSLCSIQMDLFGVDKVGRTMVSEGKIRLFRSQGVVDLRIHKFGACFILTRIAIEDHLQKALLLDFGKSARSRGSKTDDFIDEFLELLKGRYPTFTITKSSSHTIQISR